MAVVSSLGQPLTAVPAFLFVERFQLLQPCGMGFAAGCMVYITLADLLPDALDKVRPCACCLCLGPVPQGLGLHGALALARIEAPRLSSSRIGWLTEGLAGWLAVGAALAA